MQSCFALAIPLRFLFLRGFLFINGKNRGNH